jgi:hypothetical protein
LVPADSARAADSGPNVIVSASAPSAHRIVVTFKKDVRVSELTAAGYEIKDPAGAPLHVSAAVKLGRKVLLSTAQQHVVTYSARFSGGPTISFTGSDTQEPAVLSASFVDPTRVLVSFDRPMGTSADKAALYQLRPSGSTSSALKLESAKRQKDKSKVMLTTGRTKLRDGRYVVSVGDVTDGSGVYLDPTRAVAEFETSASSTALALVGIVPRGESAIELKFSSPIDPASVVPSNFAASPNLFVQSASVFDGNKILLNTGRLYQVEYTVTANGVKDTKGNLIDPARSKGTFTGTIPMDSERPKVTSAVSTGNTNVLVQFSKPMSDNAITALRYVIVQENVNGEVGTVPITSARFADLDRLTIELSTGSQNEVTYRVKVSSVTDLLGKPLADRLVVGGVLVDPTSAVFPGTPPTGSERVDTDKDAEGNPAPDGLFDHEEVAGWVVTVSLATGGTLTRQVTSSPAIPDTDGDGLSDREEKQLSIDPRDDDTDDDGLSDFSDFNEIFSDPTVQDSDGDGLSDGLEVNFFGTSAILSDTDGDRLADGAEINLGGRNPKVADLPQPGLKIGESTLGLDVRFVENVTKETGTERRELERKTSTATLVQASRNEFSATNSTTTEYGLKVGVEGEYSIKAEASVTPKVIQALRVQLSTEASFGQSFTSEATSSSSLETQRAYEDSTETSEETASKVAEGSSINREVLGASMKVAVNLRAEGNLAFRIRNTQVTAFMQDPEDPTRLRPVATLLPDSEPELGFNLGPLSPEKGPFIFSNDQIFPSDVEKLMKQPRGLVFRFSNYDIEDELGRNFAFASQEINDRTAALVIDHGGFDSDGDGVGDGARIYRVATGTGRVMDTNDDGTIDDRDRKIVFDADGKMVGVTLLDALQSLGLTELTQGLGEPLPPLPHGVTEEDSYVIQTYQRLNDTSEPIELRRISRIGKTKVQVGTARIWEVITPTGVDRAADPDSFVLMPGRSLTLAFVRDEDDDGLPAVVEFLNGCSDTAKDTDNDGLDDRFETMIGWTIDTTRGSRSVLSSCSTDDSDLDGVKDFDEAPGTINRDGRDLIDFSAGRSPERNVPSDLEPYRVHPDDTEELLARLADPITDPSDPDSDLDGMSDWDEAVPREVTLRNGHLSPALVTSAEFFDSDGDMASDRIEEFLGGDPRKKDSDNFNDTDGDGLVNVQEGSPYEITVHGPLTETALCKNFCPEQPPATREVSSDPEKADTDGDGLTDFEEYDLQLDPSQKDTDADGLSDLEEVMGYELPVFGIVRTSPLDFDSDNDKRSDGAEANRFPQERIIVRVPGAAPTETFSNPEVPDTDLDFMVDGDEASHGTDPQNFDTDGDGRSDWSEADMGRRPLVKDLRVTVNYGLLRFNAGSDQWADPSDALADIEFELGAKGMTNTNAKADAFSSNNVNGLLYEATCANSERFHCHNPRTNAFQVSKTQPEIRAKENSFVDLGGISTTPLLPESFRLTGYVREMDGNRYECYTATAIGSCGPNDTVRDCEVLFPDLFADPDSGTGVIEGVDIKEGTHQIVLNRTALCLSGARLQFSLIASYTAD